MTLCVVSISQTKVKLKGDVVIDGTRYGYMLV
jgi:hypothetical protein